MTAVTSDGVNAVNGDGWCPHTFSGRKNKSPDDFVNWYAEKLALTALNCFRLSVLTSQMMFTGGKMI